MDRLVEEVEGLENQRAELVIELVIKVVKEERGQEAAVGMTWEAFKDLTRKEFCPNNEMQKLETKFWCHAMVGLAMLRTLIVIESPVDTMADQRTMAELLHAPTEGYAEAIMVPPILAEQFELKYTLINMMTSNQTTILRNEISNFQQRFDESFHEAWDRYKDLFCVCPHHGFTKSQQLDTIHNALNPADQDSLNSAAGGNLLEIRTQYVLTIIENKSKVCNSRNKSVVSQVKSSDAKSNSSSEIAKLTHAVNQQTSVVTTAMTAILKQFQATPPPASIKAIEEICACCNTPILVNITAKANLGYYFIVQQS
uniref:Retrotransposon gag domain-containing protein n=1 Tax=Tanacetum cinerariifolium TaxID=118510 RepID=A0A6L2JIV5_TANCI|nr:hypothetical protein [Tanacetum cinerariifolium]